MAISRGFCLDPMPLENTIELLKEKEKGILLMLEIELVVISHNFSACRKTCLIHKSTIDLGSYQNGERSTTLDRF